MKYILDTNIILIYTQDSPITTDKDFNHLSPEFLELEWVDVEELKRESKK